MTFNDFVNSWTTFLLLIALIVVVLLDIQIRTRNKIQQKKQ